MKAKLASFLGCLFIILSCSENPLPKVSMETSAGTIIVEIDTVNAPITATNFLNLVEQGVYDNCASFYRTVRLNNQAKRPIKIEVIQGGLNNDSLILSYSPIKHETTAQTGIKHLDGVISMARYTPGTASTEFFICIGNQPELDYGGKRNSDEQGFAAFGKVIKGMDVVKMIQLLPDTSQYLIDSVNILNMKVH